MRKLLVTLILTLIPISVEGYEYPNCADNEAKGFEEIKDWDHCFGTVIIQNYFENLSIVTEKEKPHNYETNLTYTGEFKNGLPDGNGFAWLDYDSGLYDGRAYGYYEGQLKKGLPNGKGILSYDLGVLTGTWMSGCINWNKLVTLKTEDSQLKVVKRFGKLIPYSYFDGLWVEEEEEDDVFWDSMCTFTVVKNGYDNPNTIF